MVRTVETVPMDKLVFAVDYLIDVLNELSVECTKRKRRPRATRGTSLVTKKKKTASSGGSKKVAVRSNGHSRLRKRINTKNKESISINRNFQTLRDVELYVVSFYDIVLQSARRFTLEHRWTEAASIMPSVLEMITVYPLVVWKVGSLVLLNHRESCPEHMKHFANKIIHMCQLHQIDVIFDHVTHLMNCGDYAEAQRYIQASPVQEHRMAKMSRKYARAYREGFRALVEYLRLTTEKSEITKSATEVGDDFHDEADDDHIESDKQNVHYMRACDGFRTAARCKGNMDVFVDCYVRMLESEGEFETAIAVLKGYTKTNKRHPSPFAFYYEFLERSRRRRLDDYDDDDNDEESDVLERKMILRKLVKRNPSDPRILQLYELFNKKDFASRFTLMANTVDHAGWRNDVEVWNHLATMITKESEAGSVYQKTLDEIVKDRASFWSPFHFNVGEVSATTVQANIDLYTSKTIVAATVYGDEHPFVTAVTEVLIEMKLTDDVARIKTEIASIKSMYGEPKKNRCLDK